ncbi:uncharacterized protein LOC126809628 [Patella vulgata]|uniref:uncharacterized protein LOC126809628 n=1 Tax=Patella vulgata TaxID=6465 RepID=UPI00217FAD09|nr:uncharacterized protein LOC126809628 [Patella vulgata]
MKSFLLKEKNVLLQLLQKNREILECKDVNSETKKNVWESIHEEFHSHKGVMKREVKQLRKFWENTKLRYKKLYSGSSEVNTDIFCMLQDPDYSLPDDTKDDEKQDDNKAHLPENVSEGKSEEPEDNDQDDPNDIIYISINEEEDNSEKLDIEMVKDEKPPVTDENNDLETEKRSPKLKTETESSAIKSQLKLKITLPKPADNNNNTQSGSPRNTDLKEESHIDKPQLKLRLSRKRKGTPAKFVDSKKTTDEESLNSLAELCNKVPSENDIHLFDIVSQTVTNDLMKGKPPVPDNETPQNMQIPNDLTSMNQKYSIPVSSNDHGIPSTRIPDSRRFTSQLFNVEDAVRYQIPPPYQNQHLKGRNRPSVPKANEPETFKEFRRFPEDPRGLRSFSTLHYLGNNHPPPPSAYLDHFHHPRLPSAPFQSSAGRLSVHKDVTSQRFPRNIKSNGSSDPPLTEQDFLKLQMEQEKAYHAAKLSLIRTDLDLFESEHQAKMHLLASQCSVVELQRQYWTKVNNQLNGVATNQH